MTVKACEVEWGMAFNGSVPGFPPPKGERRCGGESVGAVCECEDEDGGIAGCGFEWP